MTTDQIKQLYRQCFPEVAAYILKNSGTQADAEDAFQKALYGVLRRSADLPPIEDMAGYLFRASRNNFLKAINGSRPPSPATDPEGEKDDTADDDEQPDGSAESDAQDLPADTGSLRTFPAEPVDPDPLPDEQLYLAERRAATYRALLDLAPGERQIIELSFDDTHPLTDAEIAEQLHIQPASVPVKRARAVAKLRSLMRQRGYT